MNAIPAGNGRSLGARLSGHLALQTFLGLAAVSLLVFLTIRAHLYAREERALDEMQALVVHLVEEAAGTPRAEGIEHALRDQFAGREEARLELFDSAGQRLLPREGRAHAESDSVEAPPNGRQVVREFILPSPREHAPGVGALRARLALVTARDDALLRRLAVTLLAGVLVGTVAVSAAAYWRVRRELGSLGRLVEQIDELDAARLGLSRRLDGEAQPSELQPLIARFNELLDRLDRSYREMAAFNADVAHELNTPLATLIASNEIVARSGSDLSIDHEELIGSNLEELQRLRGIVRDMLFLSTAERGTQARRSAVPSLAAEVREVIDYHEAALESAGLDAEVVGEASARVDIALVRRAVSNLLGNATRHAERGTRIEVHIESLGAESVPDGTPAVPGDLGSSTAGIRLAVVNRGATVAPGDLERLFERFFRVDGDARSSAESETLPTGAVTETPVNTRHGLGLPIVAAIARMHGGTPFATSHDGVTTVGFTLLANAQSVHLTERVA